MLKSISKMYFLNIFCLGFNQGEISDTWVSSKYLIYCIDLLKKIRFNEDIAMINSFKRIVVT
jgi:hypothetical protein